MLFTQKKPTKTTENRLITHRSLGCRRKEESESQQEKRNHWSW